MFLQREQNQTLTTVLPLLRRRFVMIVTEFDVLMKAFDQETLESMCKCDK